MSQLPLTITVASLTPGFEGGFNDYDSTLPDRISISTQQSIALIVAGSTEPTSDEGLWFKNNNTLYYWSDSEGRYKPIILEAESQKYVLSAAAPDQTKYELWVVLNSSGQGIDLRTYYNGAWRSTIIGTANAVAVFNPTGEGLTMVPTGTAGDPLVSNGAAAAATFQAYDPRFIGELIVMSGTTPPSTNYVRCDGAAQLRASYPLLDAYYAALAYPYGSGDGVTTFNVPDDVGRVLVGAGTGTAADATAHALGSEGGTETHTLTAAQTPAHTHANGSYTKLAQTGTGGEGFDTTPTGTTVAFAAASSIGGSGSHPNLQPYFTGCYFVRAK